MTQIYLIRHGESEHNANTMHVMGGQTENSSLTLKGIKQAVLLAERLKREEIEFDKIYSSTTNRTRETAEIVAKKLNHPLEKIVFGSEIVELDHGDFTGRLRSEIYTPEFKKFLDEHSWEFTPPRGESQKMVAERMKGYIDSITQSNKSNATIAVFTHGTASRALLCKIMGFHPKYIFRMDIENTAITELHYTGNEFRVHRINDYAHLR